MFFLKLVLKNSLYPEPASKNGDKQLRSVSMINLTTVVEFCKTSTNHLEAKI